VGEATAVGVAAATAAAAAVGMAAAAAVAAAVVVGMATAEASAEMAASSGNLIFILFLSRVVYTWICAFVAVSWKVAGSKPVGHKYTCADLFIRFLALSAVCGCT
jgi:hypothetical protein